MGTSHEQETSNISVTYARTAYYSSDKEAGSHGRWFAPHQSTISPKARPCQREAAAKAGKAMRRRVGRVQMQHHDTAVCFVGYCSMLMRVLCAVFFLLQTRAVGEKSTRALGSGATHAHRTARPTHALHNAPRWRQLTAFA